MTNPIWKIPRRWCLNSFTISFSNKPDNIEITSHHPWLPPFWGYTLFNWAQKRSTPLAQQGTLPPPERKIFWFRFWLHRKVSMTSIFPSLTSSTSLCSLLMHIPTAYTQILHPQMPLGSSHKIVHHFLVCFLDEDEITFNWAKQTLDDTPFDGRA